jgi:hypothetical protein
MLVLIIVGIAQAEAFVFDLAAPAPLKRKKRRITTNPLITTPRFDQRRLGIATEATMLADYHFGFHAVVGHHLSWFLDTGRSSLVPARQVRPSANRSILSDDVDLSLMPTHPMVDRHRGL